MSPRRRRQFIKELKRAADRCENQLKLLSPEDRAVAETALRNIREHIAEAKKI